MDVSLRLRGGRYGRAFEWKPDVLPLALAAASAHHYETREAPPSIFRRRRPSVASDGVAVKLRRCLQTRQQ